jgi:DNA mismatch repair protein MutH
MKLPYNPNNKKSVINYAKKLKGQTLRKVCEPAVLGHAYSGKGNFGQVLEKFYFGYDPNSNLEADFAKIGMELKSSPLKKLKNNEFRAKERLVLNIINYMNVVQQDFETSDFFKKNASILLIFYLHEPGYDILDYVIKLIEEWRFPTTDLEIIKKDWEKIKLKIADGKAHELSEGDTFYLGACTKGGKGGNARQQPNNIILAKQRAYSFKQGYVNHIIASIANEESEIYGKLIPSVEVAKKKTIEEIVISKFKPFYGRTAKEIISILGIEINIAAKSFHANLTKAILGIELDKEIEEFEKADIEIKTIRVEENDNIIQSVSFPAFEFTQIYNESWINSEMKDIVEKKFLFIFFKNNGQNYVLDKIKFWNMPYNDRKEVRKVWLKTKLTIQNGNIFKDYERDSFGKIRQSIKGNPIKLNNLPKMSENKICHVRPHGADSTKVFPLPVKDKKLKVNEYSKQCFWLNNTYIRDEIYIK